jgi:hypothetical protein
MKICFDVLHLYYLTQFLPVLRVLAARGVDCRFCFYRDAEMQRALEQVIERETLAVVWVESQEQAASYYREQRFDWVIFGNAFEHLSALAPQTRTAQLYHGIGMKSDVYNLGLMEMDVRFIEGPHYTKALQELYPGRALLEVGYAKLDPLFGPTDQRPRLDLAALGLDTGKPTILYAPTFYPSSIELMPDEWPAQFGEFNLIVKPHFFTWKKSRYQKQRRKLGLWARARNVHVPEPHEFNLLPFMGTADLMISDASSALFEFAALDRPVIWCDFLKLRWSYRGPLRYRLRRRMDATIDQYRDICAHAASYGELKTRVCSQLGNPGEYGAKRQAYTRRLIGKTDGKVSRRIADYLRILRIVPSPLILYKLFEVGDGALQALF